MTTLKFNFTDIQIHRLGDEYWADGIHVLSALYGNVDERKIKWAEDMLPAAMKTHLTVAENMFYEKRLMITLWGVMTLAIKSSATHAPQFAAVWRHYMEDTLSAKHGQRDLMHEVMNIKRRLDSLDAQLVEKQPEMTALEANTDVVASKTTQVPLMGGKGLSDWLMRRSAG